MSDKFSKAKATTGSGELVTGVTGLNYGKLGSVFCGLNPDKTSVVVRQNSTARDPSGQPYEVTSEGLRQWGAWHSYLKVEGYNTSLMEKRDLWTVPAAWPHLFDAEATIADDYLAGDAYLQKRRAEQNSRFDRSAELRKATVANKLGYDPKGRRRGVDSQGSEPPPPPPQSSADLKTPAAPAGDGLRARSGLPPRPAPRKPKPDDEFVEGFDLP